jgi:hypothetical protein
VASLGPDAVFIFIFFFVPHIVGESLIHWLVQVAEEGRPVLLLQRAKEHRWEQRKESYGPEPLAPGGKYSSTAAQAYREGPDTSH